MEAFRYALEGKKTYGEYFLSHTCRCESQAKSRTNRDSGAFCAAVIITLLNLPLELTPESPAYNPSKSTNLLSGVGEYVHKCKQPHVSPVHVPKAYAG